MKLDVKKLFFVVSVMTFSSLTAAVVMDCDDSQCNKGPDGLTYCPKDACKPVGDPGKGAGGGT